MKQMLIMRRLRFQYRITLGELAAAAGIPHQHISDIELEKQPAAPYNRRLMEQAFAIVIQNRFQKNEELATEFSANRLCLLDRTKEDL